MEKYIAPELKLVGQADQVILGEFIAGNDIRDEFMIPGTEFEADVE